MTTCRSQIAPVNQFGSTTTVTDNGASKHDIPDVSLNMHHERNRLKTFDHWPCTFMNPRDLAKAGFYYYNFEDAVKCVFCNIEISRWEQGDDAMSDHQRWSNACPFVRGLNVGNVPIDPTEEPPANPSSEDTCGRFGIQLRPNSVLESSDRNIDLQRLGITPSRNPVYPTYSTFESRIKSFQEWPRSMKQKPEELAEAGFFYTGKGDQTLCFSCGGGLKDWIETDDPWEQHSKWFSKCSFVLMVKGNAYVSEVCNRLDALLTPQQGAELEPRPSTSEIQSAGTSETRSSVAAPVETAVAESSEKKKSTDDGRLCKICFTEEMGVLFLPCSHIVACVKCAPSLTTCAVCRQPFTATVRAFLS